MRSLLVGLALMSVALTAPKVDSVNTFDAPNTVVPKPVSAKLQGSKLTLKLEPKSVIVISVE
jgi:alpha-N-arabinofuranosidase